MFDAHNHLHSLSEGAKIKDALAHAREAGIAWMMDCGVGLDNDWDKLQAVAETHPDQVLVSFGVHPAFINTAPIDWKVALERKLGSVPSCVGEVGIDKVRSGSPIEEQIEVMDWQLDLAHERSLAVTLHCVKAWDILLEHIRRRPGLRCVAHGFHGSVELTRELVQCGVHISFGPSVLDPRRHPIGESIRAVPRELLLAETDSVRIKYAGRENGTDKVEDMDADLARLPLVIGAVAAALGMDATELRRQTRDNALKLFRKSA
jgi:TatD DNase family protein